MTKPKAETQKNVYEEKIVDLSCISAELSDKAKRFIFWYCFPGSDAFRNKKRAAIAAGYASRNASITGYKLCKNPQITKEIRRISENYNSENIDGLYQRYLSALELRAFYDPGDFISGAEFKPIEKIAPDKRVCLEQPVFEKGEIVGFNFASRQAAMKEIRDLRNFLEKQCFDDNADGDEETMEIIMERLAIKKIARQKKDEINKISGLVCYPKGDPITEL